MADERDPRIITPIPADLLREIDDYRFANRVPSRSEAIRRLIRIGLDASGSAKPASAADRDQGPSR